jgi:DNA anti-recombination protein RmuC
MTPKPESRISALELRTASLEAGIVELSSDTAEELRAIHQHVGQGFDQAHAFVQERFEEINTRLDRIEQVQTDHGNLLQEHSQMLKEILALLKPRPSE